MLYNFKVSHKYDPIPTGNEGHLSRVRTIAKRFVSPSSIYAVLHKIFGGGFALIDKALDDENTTLCFALTSFVNPIIENADLETLEKWFEIESDLVNGQYAIQLTLKSEYVKEKRSVKSK
jgi:hypothetical protein